MDTKLKDTVIEIECLFRLTDSKNFRESKNRIVSILNNIFPYLNFKDDTLSKLLEAGLNINMVTIHDHWNILMFLSIWEPSLWTSSYDKMVQDLILAGLNLDYQDRQGHDIHWYIQQNPNRSINKTLSKIIANLPS